MKVLTYLGKILFHVCTTMNHVMKNKLPYCNLWIVFQTKCKLINVFLFKYFFLLVLFINLGVVAAMSPSMAKLSAILNSECVESEP